MRPELKTIINHVVPDAIHGLADSYADANELFDTIRHGYNSLNGYKLPDSSHRARLLKERINKSLKTALNAYGKKLTPQEYLELHEAIRDQLNVFADRLQAQYGFAEPMILHAEHRQPQRPQEVPLFAYHPDYVARGFSYPSFTIFNLGNNQRCDDKQSNNKNDNDKNKNSIATILMAILAMAMVIASGIVSGLYASLKGYKSIKNVMAKTKMTRSVFRLTGIALGAYIGITTGIIAGSALGLIIPGVSIFAGAIIGGLFCAGIGAGFGAITTKYLSKFVSWMRHGQTNPDKWTLSEKENAHLVARGFKMEDNIRDQIEPLMNGIKTTKRKKGVTPEQKAQLNHLLKMLRSGDVKGAFELDDQVYPLEAPKQVEFARPDSPVPPPYDIHAPAYR